MNEKQAIDGLKHRELQTTDDVVFMVNTVLMLFQKGFAVETMENESADYFEAGLELLTKWRDALIYTNEKIELSDNANEKIKGLT